MTYLEKLDIEYKIRTAFLAGIIIGFSLAVILLDFNV